MVLFIWWTCCELEEGFTGRPLAGAMSIVIGIERQNKRESICVDTHDVASDSRSDGGEHCVCWGVRKPSGWCLLFVRELRVEVFLSAIPRACKRPSKVPAAQFFLFCKIAPALIGRNAVVSPGRFF